MPGPKRKKGIPCVYCKSENTFGWSAGRRKCGDCGKSYLSTPYQKDILPPATDVCDCGAAKAVRIGNRARTGISRVRCSQCKKTWLEGAKRKPDDAAAKRVLVVTSAVNDTRVNSKFLATLKVYCEARNAQLVVIPIRYKNPTSQAEGKQEPTWAAVLAPYLYDRRMKACAGLQVLADIKIQPTAVDPLSGLDTLTGTDCGIFGHPKVAMRSVATRGHELPKLLLTTGAVTLPVYSDSKAGKKGEFHHVHGAVIVETTNKAFHLRHIHAASDGSFIDLDKKYSAAGITTAPPPTLVLGDIHAERADPKVMAATAEIQKVLKPRRLVCHDVLDFGSASHHNSFWERFARRVKGTDKVAEELKLTAALLDSLHRKGQEVVIVSSNHHDHLGRWLADHRNGDDVQNAGIYHRAKAAVLSAIESSRGKVPNIFQLILEPLLKKPITFLGDGDSLSVSGIELGFHGHRGANGARGSAKSFDRIGAKTVVGHGHAPGIEGGCFQTGTSSLLDMGYNLGAPSSWLQSHVVIYGNGKRSHIHIIDGEWRA
jgi:hypothetical protein